MPVNNPEKVYCLSCHATLGTIVPNGSAMEFWGKDKQRYSIFQGVVSVRCGHCSETRLFQFDGKVYNEVAGG